MTAATLEELKSKLPADYAKTLSETCNVSTDMVYKVMRNDRINMNVIREAYKLAEKHKHFMDKIKKL